MPRAAKATHRDLGLITEGALVALLLSRHQLLDHALLLLCELGRLRQPQHRVWEQRGHPGHLAPPTPLLLLLLPAQLLLP